jgi:hypothetical protein
MTELHSNDDAMGRLTAEMARDRITEPIDDVPAAVGPDAPETMESIMEDSLDRGLLESERRPRRTHRKSDSGVPSGVQGGDWLNDELGVRRP